MAPPGAPRSRIGRPSPGIMTHTAPSVATVSCETPAVWSARARVVTVPLGDTVPSEPLRPANHTVPSGATARRLASDPPGRVIV